MEMKGLAMETNSTAKQCQGDEWTGTVLSWLGIEQQRNGKAKLNDERKCMQETVFGRMNNYN